MSRLRASAMLGIAVLFSLGFPAISHAAWPHSPGTNLPICTPAGDQHAPESIPDGAGGVLITWMDGRSGNFDIYVQHVLASGAVDPAWPANGRALCTAADNQGYPRLASDGSGGAIVAWHDYRTGVYDIYAQHVLASGAVDGAWPVNGRLLCGAVNDQTYPAVVSDGAGGAIVTWTDARSDAGDFFAQRILSTGVVDPAWPINGQVICNAAGFQEQGQIVTDGAGGAIIVWADTRSGTYDIYAQRIQASGVVDPAWPANGRGICVQPNTQSECYIASDGAGGAVISWHDLRSGTYDIYAQHVLATGFVDPAWVANGTPICTAGAHQFTPRILGDGAGGAFLTWYDFRSGPSDIYAHHVLASGAVDGAWPTDGRALCVAASDQQSPRLASDGAGGAIVAWQDSRGPNIWDIYAQRVSSSGVVDPAWPTDGRALSTAMDIQANVTIVADGAGGALVAWQDYRSGTHHDIYAQRVAPSGYLGNPEPVLADVRDLPLDQGGKVKLTWNASYLDTEQPYVVDHYWVFRNAPPALVAEALAEGARLLRPGDAAPLAHERAFLVTHESAAGYSWEFVASTPAAHFTSNYSYVATTTSDSIGASNPLTAFLIVAYNASNSVFFASNPDSGYSVDNLPPLVPAPFTGNYAAGATHLHWNPNAEPDVAFYRLYRGASAGFVPGPGNLIASPPDTGHADAGVAGSYYKLSAVDVHGNESGYALLTPQMTVGVGDEIPAELALGRPSPNPAETNVRVHLALPRESRVSLLVHDLAGREVRALVSGRFAAGERDVSWDLRDASGGRVAAGIYFLRLEVDSRTITRRIAVVN